MHVTGSITLSLLAEVMSSRVLLLLVLLGSSKYTRAWLQRYRIMEEQAVMFRSGQISLVLSLALALLALVAVSGNMVLALLASACMIAVITIFLGAMELMGWTIGALLLCCGLSMFTAVNVHVVFAEYRQTDARFCIDVGIA